MILLPYGHEQTTVRRLPWVTLGLLSICLAAFFISGRAGWAPAEDRAIHERAFEALEYYSAHPYLELEPEFEEIFLTGRGDDELLGVIGDLGLDTPMPLVLEAEQQQLDAMTDRAIAAYRDHTLRRWGLVPANKTAVGLVAHMFLHAGWLHLIGNMLILLLAGPFIEDVWGRPIYAGFYLLAGGIAAGFHILSDPGSDVPMIGASGAIAGLMGAFLVRYGSTQIRFFYLFLLVRGTFRAPAWLMIPLWFLSQVWMGLLTDELEVGAGVAYWAHVGGFVAGVTVAWVMRSQRVEERFVAPQIEEKITLALTENEAVVDAVARREEDPDLAFRMLSLAVMNDPANYDGAGALWELAGELEREAEAAPLMLRSIGHQLRKGDVELALEQWMAVQERVWEVEGDPRVLVRLAQELLERDRVESGLRTLQIVLHDDTVQDPLLSLKIARLSHALDPELARQAAEITLDHAAADPAARQEAADLIRALGATPVACAPLAP